jgi:hypothetical protein
MRPIIGTLAGLVLLCTSAVSQAQWMARRDAARASFALAERAAYFQRVVQLRAGYNFLTDEAHRFALTAQQLHRDVQRGATYEQALMEFAILERTYGDLSRAFERAHQAFRDLSMLREWELLERNMNALEAAMLLR